MNDDEYTVDIEVGHETRQLVERLSRAFTELPVRTKRRQKLVLQKGEERLIHELVKSCARFVLVGSDAAVELENRTTGQRWSAYSLARMKFIVDQSQPLHNLFVCNVDHENGATAVLTTYDD